MLQELGPMTNQSSVLTMVTDSGIAKNKLDLASIRDLSWYLLSRTQLLDNVKQPSEVKPTGKGTNRNIHTRANTVALLKRIYPESRRSAIASNLLKSTGFNASSPASRTYVRTNAANDLLSLSLRNKLPRYLFANNPNIHLSRKGNGQATA